MSRIDEPITAPEGRPPEAQLRTHLADFETTTTALLRPREAVALLNFAALFHETVYLTDTALGDHQLIIKSFQQQGDSGLFGQLKRFIEFGILRVLVRDKVVVRGEVRTPQQPTIADIYDGWRYRDSTERGGETGFTTVIDEKERQRYNAVVNDLLHQHRAIQWYNPDQPKQAFRDRILTQINSDAKHASLARVVGQLPSEIRNQYLQVTQDLYFTNAELWRVLKSTPAGEEAIILHGHMNQQCFADVAHAGQSGSDRTEDSLVSFNMELRLQSRLSMDLSTIVDPPANLEALLERAAVRLPSPSVGMFERLSPEAVIAIRRKAGPLFEIAGRPLEADQVEATRQTYLKALEKYWHHILEEFSRRYPAEMEQPTRVSILLQEKAPPLGWLYKNFKDVFVMLLRLHPKVGVFARPATNLLERCGLLILYEPTSLASRLAQSVPPRRWYRRGLFGLDPYRVATSLSPTLPSNDAGTS